MANYTAADVKKLREETGAGMMDVKNALTEADGDHDKALEIIRLKGLKSLSKREDRDASAGLIAAKVVDNTVGVMIEVNAETDFVAKNQKFIEFANSVLDAAIASKASNLDSLLAAPLGDDTVQDSVNNMGAIIGEKIQIRHISRVEGDHVDVYLHQTNPDLPPQLGVLVVTDPNAGSIARDIAMHVAVYQPDYMDRDCVPSSILDTERATLEKLTRQEGKPENMIPKIIEGRLSAFFKENCLVDQDFARDPSKTVSTVLKEANGKITGYVRMQVGGSFTESIGAEVNA